MELISRREAMERGLRYYFTGKPCVNGHTVERYVKGGSCRKCACERSDKWGKDNPESLQVHRYKARRAWLNRVAKINALKLEQGCVDCGYRAHPQALEFDHRDPKAKLFNISEKNYSWDRMLKEIAKCDIRCANCHRVRTFTINRLSR